MPCRRECKARRRCAMAATARRWRRVEAAGPLQPALLGGNADERSYWRNAAIPLRESPDLSPASTDSDRALDRPEGKTEPRARAAGAKGATKAPSPRRNDRSAARESPPLRPEAS